MPSKNKLNILMITGVYLPEINGAVRQCTQLINNLKDSINYSVLTGTNNESCHGQFNVEGISVTKVYINKSSKFKYVVGIVNFYNFLISILKNIDLVHIHGFSNRNAIAILICIIFKKRVIIKMTSYGYDDPMSIKKLSFLSWNIFKCCHAYIGISPAFSKSYKKTGQLESKYNFIPNGVDLIRYNKINSNDRKILRLKYGFSAQDLIFIFVGHFSPEKRPMLLYKAWVKLLEKEICAKLIFIGRTREYFEVDERIIDEIKLDALQRGILHMIHFVEETHHVDEFMKIADVFVLPSMREGLPNVLLEAMACALPCIVSELPGVTDWLIEDGKTGEILRSDVPEVLTEKLMSFVAEPGQHISIGLAARKEMERNFSCTATSQAVLDLYSKIMKSTSLAS
jgi:glycosyltransferase involved in cell wall biosynthesis